MFFRWTKDILKQSWKERQFLKPYKSCKIGVQILASLDIHQNDIFKILCKIRIVNCLKHTFYIYIF